VNCAAIPENLLESEVFGVRPGAFTGAVKAKKGRLELASHGTLFLDEIGDMPLSLQAKLLRVLQEKSFMPLGGEREEKADVRFVFATHRDLSREVAEHRFREDLYYRVAVVPIELPPLRARGDDVIALALAFAEDAARRMGRPAVRLTEDARRALRTAAFPGNVRELANVVERAVILGEGDAIEAADLALAPAVSVEQPSSSVSTPVSSGPFALPTEGVSLEAVERSLIEQALARTDGNKSQAARLLGLTRATLRYRIEKLGLE
jgi:transcriptional regulator with GAF, ATPase, and Fis domain